MLKLHNTLTKKIEDFTPIDEQNIRLYSCGPSVYFHAHIGNLSSYIFADTLRRALAISEHNVTLVMNYTDVDDKSIRNSLETYPELEPREALEKLTTHYTGLFLEDMKKIGNDIAAITFIRATDHIEAMKQLIKSLHEKGFAYIAHDGVYFSIEAYKKSGKTYGQLLEINTQNTSQARIANDEYDKESAHDFALWKTQKEGEPAWEFELEGKNMLGRPGWHVECSAMSRAHLGQPFDIHTGGIDLIFPHHENEIAQSTAGEENPTMATVFVHNEHLLVDGKKMAKSANNFYTLDDIIKKGFSPLAFRLLVLQSHYRSQAHFSWKNLEAAQNRLKNWQAVAALRWQAVDVPADDYMDHIGEVDGDTHSPLFDDLNTPEALATIDRRFSGFARNLISKKNLDGFVEYLRTVDEALGTNLEEVSDITENQKQVIAEREKARQSEDWPTSDKLREDLKEQRIGVRDTDHGAAWYRIDVV